MISYEQFCQIHDLHQRQALNASQISRVLKLDHKTVTTWLARPHFISRTTAKRNSLLEPFKDKVEAEGSEPPIVTLAIRLQFEFAARRSEILLLEWTWVDLENRRVAWPDSKTGGMSKPMSEEAHRLLSTVPRHEGSLYVLPSLRDPLKHMTNGEHYNGWSRILKAAEPPFLHNC